MQVTLQFLMQLIADMFLINLTLAFFLVLFDRKKPSSTLAWLMVFLFIPVIGFLFYLLIGQDLRKAKLFELKGNEEAGIKKALANQRIAIQSKNYTFNDERQIEYSDIMRLNMLSSQAVYTQDNDLEIINDGEELFQSLLNSINSARKNVHMEYYIVRADNTGKAIVNALEQAALRGVTVRLLCDGMGCLKIPHNFFKRLKDAGGLIAVFFPPLVPYINFRINYRNHRKICVIDGETAFIGGFNIGDEYRSLSSRYGNWRDIHIKLHGSAVHELQMRFLLDWRYAAVAIEQIDSIEDYFYDYTEDPGNIGMQIISSGPDSKWHSIHYGYLKIINSAVDHIYIETPYFIPDEAILKAMKIASLSGVDIRIIIPGKPDHPFVLWAAMSYIGELLDTGVKFYTYDKGFVHSKMMTSDGFISSVGTANVDIRSFQINFEVNAFIYDEATSIKLEQIFLADMNDSIELTAELYAQRSYWDKTKEAFSRLISPLL